MSIDSDYPLKPPKCVLLKSEEHKSQFNAACIDENNNITIFEKTWCSSITVQDVIHLCSVIVQGEDPRYVISSIL